MIVQKFGGTSVGSAAAIRAVIDIISKAENPVVVVSAMSGVTNELVRLAQAAAARHAANLTSIRQKHADAALELGVSSDHERLLSELEQLLHGVSLIRDASPRVLDSILAYGELLSARLVAAALNAANHKAIAVDARALIVTDDTHGRAIVDRATSYQRAKDRLGQIDGIAVVTGFIAANPQGTTTTLGRGGSDYTATLIGAAINAERIEIWTDVDGVMSADPRQVPQAFPLPRITYTELMELSHFGAKVIYPPSVTPARDAAIPLAIRNTFKTDFPGTEVVPDHLRDTRDLRTILPKSRASSPLPTETAIRGVTSINNVALCRLEGAGMLGVPGISSRLFGALARDGISVILISQASSEHSICFAVEPEVAARAARSIDKEFNVERAAGAVDALIVEEELAVIAIVGEAMRDTPGIAGRLFDVLGRNGISVRAIAQGSSELNISLVVPRIDETRALRLVHDAFYLPRVRTVQVFIAGTGRVGAALLDQIAQQAEQLPARVGVRLIVSGIARSSKAIVSHDGIALRDWNRQLSESDTSVDAMIDHALHSKNAHKIFVDCTAHADVVKHYEALMRTGAAIVSANKIALSQSMDAYRQLKDLAQTANGMYMETTVGAGLPVLRPIADLVATGDKITRIEGVLSGTLSYLFGQLRNGVSFSEAVKDAHARGFTEPDPRDDLSGRDVARKLLILGREAGFEIEPEDVQVDPVLQGERWEKMSLDEFWSALPGVDAEFAGKKMAYLGVVDASGARVSTHELPASHPTMSLRPGDNLIMVTSERYNERPLVIQGPGAGPAVTAAGVFADILRAANEAR